MKKNEINLTKHIMTKMYTNDYQIQITQTNNTGNYWKVIYRETFLPHL